MESYEKYKNYLANYDELYVAIGNVSDLDLTKLESIKKDSRIKGICVKCGNNQVPQCYSFEEYEDIKKVIDNIIGMVKLPNADDPNRDKLIFAQIYKILGKNIRYDHYAISAEGEKDKKLSCDCRNLKNGLLGVRRNGKKELLTVCAGYATILQNLCACFNIKCDYLRSNSMPVWDNWGKYENGTSDPMGHAYNAVYLDGKAYLCDLTWDANNMKLDQLGENFLRSYEEFCKTHKDEGFSSDNVTVVTQSGETRHALNPQLFIHSCSDKEQLQLFGMVAKGNIDEMISEGYLANFAMSNIEYIKQVRGRVGMLEYIELIQTIHGIEDYITSPHFKAHAGWPGKTAPSKIFDEQGNVIVDKSFVFYPGAEDLSPDDAISEVKNMEERQWKMR